MSADEHLNDIDHIRKRPSMYVGSTGFFGTIHYLVDATNLILQHSPSCIEISSYGAEFGISSDIALPVHDNENGERFPFECFRRDGNAAISHGPVLTALSESLSYSERSDSGTIQYAYRSGLRTAPSTIDYPPEFRSHLRFTPDSTIFGDCVVSN